MENFASHFSLFWFQPYHIPFLKAVEPNRIRHNNSKRRPVLSQNENGSVLAYSSQFPSHFCLLWRSPIPCMILILRKTSSYFYFKHRQKDIGTIFHTAGTRKNARHIYRCCKTDNRNHSLILREITAPFLNHWRICVQPFSLLSCSTINQPYFYCIASFFGCNKTTTGSRVRTEIFRIHQNLWRAYYLEYCL